MERQEGSASPPGEWRPLMLATLDLRLLVPAHLTLLTESHTAEHVVLGFRTPTSDGFDEVLDLYHQHPHPDDVLPVWRTALDRLATEEGWQQLVLDESRPLVVAGIVGTYVTFRYIAARHEKQVTGIAWTGDVHGDYVAIIYHCMADRAAGMSVTMDYLLGSLHFAAQRHLP